MSRTKSGKLVAVFSSLPFLFLTLVLLYEKYDSKGAMLAFAASLVWTGAAYLLLRRPPCPEGGWHRKCYIGEGEWGPVYGCEKCQHRFMRRWIFWFQRR